ncbi:hypothetical protein ALC62_05556 [Cyphomyrmex costatus]|uniref:THAP-type domain-containing protein n=1 Tax=Cyphomyrmex costatus TaxID=456900 RepID=A0A151IJK1_9HYME|nr:hypothetical protein ALC62_05556 [Cyphomyrmex costatus]
MRSCCVPGCSSGQHAPRHAFPKNAERRKKWFESLHMEPPQEDKEIKKLRICHRHFREEDYSGSATYRVLLHFVVPFINVPQQEVVNNFNCSNHVEQHEQQEQEMLHEHNPIILQDKEEEVFSQHKQQEQEMLHEHNPMILQDKEEEVLAQHKQQEQEMLHEHNPMILQDKEEEVLVQHEQQEQETLHEHSMILQDKYDEVLAQHEQRLTQHDNIVTQQQQRIENMENILKMQYKASCVRPYLEGHFMGLFFKIFDFPKTSFSGTLSM